MKPPKKRTIGEIRQTKDSVYNHPKSHNELDYESMRLHADKFIDKEHFHLKSNLNASQYSDVISALVDYKNNFKNV
tara:strand:- start:1130 stop:1357 length:228 start_codon:yes stop_codon:yes gene_type:complete